MILTYSLDRFVPAILAGTKKHTIRYDHHNRWRAGMPIQHWRGNPRNVKNNPYEFASGVCLGVQEIEILPGCSKMKHGLTVKVDNRFLTDEEILILAENDGLTVAEMRDWFTGGRYLYRGRIIHFTDLIY